MPPRWNEETTLKFVLLYVKHECLWNANNETYRQQFNRRIALNDIMKEMNLENFTINDVKQKIKSLRATYQQEQAKIERSEQSGATDVYRPSLKWFSLMEDVMKHSTLKRKLASNNYVVSIFIVI